ncbi:MAG: hypothetical protein ACOYJZ_04465 [Acutalibacter sp.]|jgi:hypothetical protein
MGKILILNGSPRAPRSNSKEYARLFLQGCSMEAETCEITKKNHLELCRKLDGVTDVLFVFPLYADGIPVTLLNFLKTLEEHPPQNKPTLSVLINCGFLEPEQNDMAVEMVQLFAKETGYPFGSVLKIGSGEAILSTPFRFLVRRKLKKLAKAIAQGQSCTMQVTMPLTKGMFLKASSTYWENYGKKNGITRAEMETMSIEGK